MHNFTGLWRLFRTSGNPREWFKLQNVLQTTKAKCKLVWLTPAQTALPTSEITHVQGKHRRQVTWISDTQCGDTEVLSTRCTEFNVVAGVVVDSGLCQHCIVLNLALPINNTTISMPVRLHSQTWPGHRSAAKKILVISAFHRSRVRKIEHQKGFPFKWHNQNSGVPSIYFMTCSIGEIRWYK